MTGKAESFSDDENRLLRAALRKFRDERKLTQGELGDILGIKQQNVGRLLNVKNRTGMARPTANALARAIGYRDAEHLLLEHDTLADMKPPPAGAIWSDRDWAVRLSQKLGYNQAAVEAVIARFTDSTARSRPARWWLGKFLDEENDRRDERAQEMAPSASVAPQKRARREVSGGRGR